MKLIHQVPLFDLLPNDTKCINNDKYLFMWPDIYVPGWSDYTEEYLLKLGLSQHLVDYQMKMFFSNNGTLYGTPDCDVYTVDALYEQAPYNKFQNMLYQDNRTFVLVGVNHEATNMASYTQMMVSGTSPVITVESSLYSWLFDGALLSSTYTANNPIYKKNPEISSINEGLLQNMYVLPISPICNNLSSILETCYSVGYQGQWPTWKGDNELPDMSVLGFYGRSYANPTTTYGSPAEAVIIPTLLIFDAPDVDGGGDASPNSSAAGTSQSGPLTATEKIVIVVVCVVVGLVVGLFLFSKVIARNTKKDEIMRASLLRNSKINTEDAVDAL